MKPGAAFSFVGIPRLRTVALFAAFALFAAPFARAEKQAAPEEGSEPGDSWTMQKLERAVAGDDPLEGFNRSMFAVTDFGMNYLVRPIGWVWCTIFPRPVVDCLDRACDNLGWPRRALTLCGQGKWGMAGDETARFGINLTVGILGLFDPAEKWWNIHGTESDFGCMLENWGVGPGCRFVLPFSSTTNVRDALCLIPDYFLDLRTYIPYSSWTYINEAVSAHPQYERAMRGAADPYRTYFLMTTANRQLELRNWSYRWKEEDRANEPLPPERKPLSTEGLSGKIVSIPGYHPLGALSDSLRSQYNVAQRDNDEWYCRLSLFNSDFEDEARTRSISFGDDLPDFEYLYWDAPDPGKDEDGRPIPTQEKLVVILPGLNSLRDGSMALAFAELFHNAGYRVVATDSMFNWRFFESTNAKFPGYAPEDAAHLRRVLSRVLEDLRKDGKIVEPRIVVVGWSMGALDAAFLAELEARDGNKLGVARYLLCNPPVDLGRGYRTAEAYLNRTKDWTKEEAVERILNFAGTVMASTEGRTIPHYDPERQDTFTRPPVVDQEVSAYFIGTMFRSFIPELILSRHKRVPFAHLTEPCTVFNREELHKRLDRIDFEQYAKDFVMPGLENPEPDLETVVRKTSLRAIAPALKDDSRIRVLHALDDLLLSDDPSGDDRAFLDSVFGERITWFTEGGHCGQFYAKPFQDELLLRAEEP